jgi:hypothetical protein
MAVLAKEVMVQPPEVIDRMKKLLGFEKGIYLGTRQASKTLWVRRMSHLRNENHVA